MAKTLKQGAQQTIAALKTSLLKIDGAKYPDKWARKAAQLRRLEKHLDKQCAPEPTVSKSTIAFQQEQVLKQLAAGVSREERDKLVDEFEELAGWEKGVFPVGDPDAQQLLSGLVVAIETGERAKRRAA